jgi:DNA-binding MarR family transcriptional regulator
MALDNQKIPVYTAFMPTQTTRLKQDIYNRVATQCTCSNLRMASRAITQLYDEILQPSGLLATQFRLVGAIAANGSIALTPLAEQLGMDPTTLARNLKPLERDGMIDISTGDDRRTRMLKITAKGQDALTKALPLWEEAQAWVISQLGEDRWRMMLGDWSNLVTLIRQR